MTNQNISQTKSSILQANSPDSRTLFTAIFERYEETTELFCKQTHLRDVRTREGGLITKHLIFDVTTTKTITSELTIGEYVSFLADIEFKNVQFLNVFDLIGSRHE